LNRLDDSSDCIEVGELFYEFLANNFPYKDNQSKLSEFMGRIYGKDASKNFSVKDTVKNSLPRPKFRIETIETTQLGYYKDKTISLNQCIVLNAISEDSKDRFILLLTMLLEYGRFLSDVVREKAKLTPSSSNCNEGVDFAIGFMEHSEEKLLKGNFEFTDFTTIVAKGENKKYVLGISDLSNEERENIFNSLCISGNRNG